MEKPFVKYTFVSIYFFLSIRKVAEKNPKILWLFDSSFVCPSILFYRVLIPIRCTNSVQIQLHKPYSMSETIGPANIDTGAWRKTKNKEKNLDSAN